MKAESSARLGNSLLVAFTSALLLMLVNLLLPAISMRTTARAAEAKSGLHEIQLAVEKYNRDCYCYPPWLIGGGARCAATVDTSTLDDTFQDIRDCSPLAAVSDPLLREGYLAAYPSNPFVTAGVGIHQYQSRLPTTNYGKDPLCNSSKEGAQSGTRFGPECKSMGNVMGDPRQYEWVWTNPDNGHTTPAHTYADVDYHQWDMWTGDRPLPFLHGQFFYKANWELNPPTADPFAAGDSTPRTRPPTMYMLGAYGGPSDRGQDVIGDEQMITFDLGDQGSIKVWPWTRSTVSMGMGAPGSPYGSAPAGSGRQFSYGNPNGIDDAVVLLLTSE